MAAWLIEGGGELRWLGILCLGASLLYLAGMYLNDAFDINIRVHDLNGENFNSLASIQALVERKQAE